MAGSSVKPLLVRLHRLDLRQLVRASHPRSAQIPKGQAGSLSYMLTNASRLPAPVALSEVFLQVFEKTAFGQLAVEELDRSGQLVVSEAAAAEVNEFGDRSLFAVNKRYTCVDSLSPIGIGYSDYGGFLNGRVFVEGSFDLGGEYILAAGHNHVFLAIDKIDIAFIVDTSKISSIQPSIADGDGSVFGTTPITDHYVWSPRNDFADLAWQYIGSNVVDYPDIDTWHRLAAGGEPSTAA